MFVENVFNDNLILAIISLNSNLKNETTNESNCMNTVKLPFIEPK